MRVIRGSLCWEIFAGRKRSGDTERQHRPSVLEIAKGAFPGEVPGGAIAGSQEAPDRGENPGHEQGLFCKWVRRISLPLQGKIAGILNFAKTTLARRAKCPDLYAI
ncbi:MAG: hypothetical protein ACKVOI_09340 [Dongiaceae bacterium]